MFNAAKIFDRIAMFFLRKAHPAYFKLDCDFYVLNTVKKPPEGESITTRYNLTSTPVNESDALVLER